MQIATTHKNTDFDALASLVAVSLLHPEAIPILPQSLNENVKAFLAIHKDIFHFRLRKEIDLEQVKKLILVDVNSWRRLENLDPLKDRQDLEITLWDHHMDSSNIKTTWECRESIGATTTLMVREIKKRGIVISPIHATLFLAGLYEDTGNLTFMSTTAEDAYAAAFLIENKADLGVLSNFLRPAYGEVQKDILFQMLQSAKRRNVGSYNISFRKLEILKHVPNLSVVVNMYREILNVDAAFGIFLNKENDRCIVIGRSNIEGINMGAIMRGIGGGGHPAAGSAMLKAINPDAVETTLTELIQDGKHSSVQISDLMSFPVLTVPAEMTMQAARDILRDKGYSGAPVTRGDKLIGIISNRDFRKLKKKSQLTAPVKAFMSTEVKYMQPGRSPMQAVRLMVKYDIGRLPIVQEGKIIGILTRSDAMLFFYDLLPD